MRLGVSYSWQMAERGQERGSQSQYESLLAGLFHQH